MELREFTPQTLRPFLDSEEYQAMPVVPISRHRALSHINNPRVSGNDLILVLAMVEGKMAGYLGVFADYIFLKDQKEKAGWLSCMWVDPEVRGQGIAKKLLNRVLERWDNRILVTEFTPAAKGLYDRSGQFQDLKISEGLRGFLRFNLDELLPKKFPALEKFKPIISLKNWALNVPNELRLNFWKPSVETQKYRVETVGKIDEKLAAFISARQQSQLEKRSAEDLNWLLQNPWLLPVSEDDGTGKKYHFSAFDQRFEFRPLQIFNPENKLMAFVILAIRGNDLKVPYLYAEAGHIKAVAEIIVQQMLKEDLRTITVFHPELVAFFKQNPKPFLYLHPLKRHYIISKKFAKLLNQQPEVKIQDGDADCAFT
ncbi:GNAT family N-acetyltransferase [Adhaeribacter sp. BT258]|uniref:GNAT family N-acetyltransferase n=1 Tax=Adhaeribacter terrigena TaxID=2793070 RepID=A0ABS1C7D2_9BACT|nr:GNAT family N-acetyltransferase [Adhaeribacter terrigena]MBK0404495.1 GNAT family N-acetyltransferase [Adhaeribacter terrigena]